MRTGLRALAAAVAITAVGLTAGCGSSDGGGATSAAAGGGDFVAQANGICSAANDDFVALGNMQEFNDLADFQDRFAKAIDIAKQQYADIAALEPPADIAGDVQDYLTEGDNSVMMSQDLYDRVVAGEDITAAEAATLGTAKGQATIAARRKAALAAGLEACAS